MRPHRRARRVYPSGLPDTARNKYPQRHFVCGAWTDAYPRRGFNRVASAVCPMRLYGERSRFETSCRTAAIDSQLSGISGMKRSEETMATIEADAKAQAPFDQHSHHNVGEDFESDVAATQRYIDSPRVRRNHPPLFGPPGRRAARHDSDRLHRGPRGGGGLLPAAARAVRAAQEHHHLRPVLARAGRDDEADGHRGHLPRRLGDLGEGLHQRGSGTRPRQLPAQPGARRGRRAGARAADRRSQSAVPAPADDRRATRRDAGVRLPARSSSPTPTPATAAIRTCAT